MKLRKNEGAKTTLFDGFQVNGVPATVSTDWAGGYCVVSTRLEVSVIIITLIITSEFV